MSKIKKLGERVEIMRQLNLVKLGELVPEEVALQSPVDIIEICCISSVPFDFDKKMAAADPDDYPSLEKRQFERVFSPTGSGWRRIK
jgi:hypothetical protein